MLITKLNFKNFMGYKQLSLPKGNSELPNGLILISGRNSYGKSTILEGILFAFFGPKIFKGRNAASFITYGVEEKAKIYVYFTLDNKKYYIYRVWGRTGSITTKLFEWIKKKNVYQEIKKFNVEKFFEITTEQAMSTVFVRQGEVEELANKKGAELRGMIIDLFRLNIIDDALNLLDKELKSKKFAKERLEENRVPIPRIQEDITRIKEEIKQYEEILVKKNAFKEDYNLKIKSYPSKEIIDELENLYQQEEITKSKFNAYKNDFEKKIEQNRGDFEDLNSLEKIEQIEHSLLERKKEQVSKKQELEEKNQATLKGLGKTKGRIEDIEKKISKMEKGINNLSKGGKGATIRCPTCQSELTKEHYNTIIQEFNKNLQINQEKIKKITGIVKGYNKILKDLQNDMDIINNRIILIQTLRNDYQNFNKYQLESQEINKKLQEFIKKHKSKFKDLSQIGIKKLRSEIERIITELSSLEKEIKEKQQIIQNNENRIVDLSEEIDRMKELEKQIGVLEIDIDHINKAKEFVRRFVTEYMVVKRLVKNIALTTNKYIKDFTSGQYGELLLDLAGTKKTGLALKIKDYFNGEYESIEVLSGGDRTALGMALRLAISELMSILRPTKDSPRRNPKIDFLLLDEPLAALDETRRERILKHLIKSKTFAQIFLITHTSIPSDIQTHKILVEKDHSTGISQAKFEEASINVHF